jgi:hypothetical protein
MPKYEICVVSKEYRYVDILADSEGEAKDQVWDQIETILNQKPKDYDTDLYVEGTEGESK